MVKNSRSFELTKIRHYCDRPYRDLFELAKVGPPVLPVLKEWKDESLGGAIGSTPRGPECSGGDFGGATDKSSRSEPARKTPEKTAQARKTQKSPRATDSSGPPAARFPISKPTSKPLSLGEPPPAPKGETCDVRSILASAETAQSDEFAAMIDALGKASEGRVREALDTLTSLHASFGDEGPRS